MKTFKKILIVFSSYCLIVIILGIGCAKNDNYWYNEINKIVSTIDENNELLYYNDLQFYYKGKDYYFYRFVEDSKTDIAFIIEL